MHDVPVLCRRSTTCQWQPSSVPWPSCYN
jgi:hypothetical protein